MNVLIVNWPFQTWALERNAVSNCEKEVETQMAQEKVQIIAKKNTDRVTVARCSLKITRRSFECMYAYHAGSVNFKAGWYYYHNSEICKLLLIQLFFQFLQCEMCDFNFSNIRVKLKFLFQILVFSD